MHVTSLETIMKNCWLGKDMFPPYSCNQSATTMRRQLKHYLM